MSGEDTRNNPDLARFREALAKGTLETRCCSSCEEWHFPPRDFCPHCGSLGVEWKTAAGTGTIRSFTIWHRKDGDLVPALVGLDEGPSVLTRIAGCDSSELAIGMPVELDAEQSAEAERPVFRIRNDKG